MASFKQFVFESSTLKQKIRKVAQIMINLMSMPSVNEARQIKAHDITLKYWQPNSPLISLLRKHGIPIPSEVPQYVDGGAGRCYMLDDFVVKMSANRVEANVANMVANKDHLPTPIIDVAYLGDNIYAILQHYVDVKNIPDEIKQAADFLTAVVDDYPEMESFPEDKQEQQKLCVKALLDNGGSLHLLPFMISLMDNLIQIYKETGFKHNDAGPTNIGMRNGQVVIPDLGPNQDKDFDPLSTLAQMRKNRERMGLPKTASI